MVKLLTTLDEAQKRWFVGREAMLLGHGGLKRMCELSGLSKPTVIRGIRELKGKGKLRDEGRVRQAGGGRKPLQEHDPEALNLLQRIMEENTVGDPMSLLKWSSKSTYQIRDQLVALGHPMSEDTVARWLKELDYSLQANVKEREGSSPPERDSQFRYINALAKKYMARREPVISVDAKKKERVGAFKNGGRQWRAKGNPVEVNVYDIRVLRWERRCLTERTTCKGTKAWLMWECLMTQQNLPWKAFADGGARSVGRSIQRPAGY